MQIHVNRNVKNSDFKGLKNVKKKSRVYKITTSN